jgi:hypothetical protein
MELRIANMKAYCGLCRFSGRGLSRAHTEVRLMVLAHHGLTIVRALKASKEDRYDVATPMKHAA